MLFRLLLLFVTVPLVELVLLLYLARIISPLGTFLLVVVTGIVGALLARRQGWRAVAHLRNDVSQGRVPTDTLIDAIMILFAGALLLTPGVLTDCFGFSLLVPPLRRRYRSMLHRWLRSRFTIRSVSTTTRRSSYSSENDQIIDSYVVDHKENGANEKQAEQE